MTASDPDSPKKGDRQAWGLASAAYAREMVESFAPVGKHLMSALQPEPGTRIIDVACGAGEPALTAARYLRGRGRVVGVDVSKTMISLAQRLARQLGLRGVHFAVMDGEALACRTGEFDLALCRFGVMLVPDPERMLAEMRRVLHEGGRVALATWGESDNVPLLKVGREVITSYFPQLAQAGVPAPGDFGMPGELEGALKAAGFHGIQTEKMTLDIGFSSAAALWGAMSEGTSLKLLLSESPADLVSEIRAAVERAAQAYFNAARQRVELPSEILIGVART